MRSYYVSKLTSFTAAVPFNQHVGSDLIIWKLSKFAPIAVMSKLLIFASILKFNWEDKFKKWIEITYTKAFFETKKVDPDYKMVNVIWI